MADDITKVTIEFSTPELAEWWLAYMCDGGGEYEAMKARQLDCLGYILFDYEDCFPKVKDNARVIVKEVKELV